MEAAGGVEGLLRGGLEAPLGRIESSLPSLVARWMANPKVLA